MGRTSHRTPAPTTSVTYQASPVPTASFTYAGPAPATTMYAAAPAPVTSVGYQAVPYATVSGPDYNGNGIPDQLEQRPSGPSSGHTPSPVPGSRPPAPVPEKKKHKFC